jgi:hypothetical protein
MTMYYESLEVIITMYYERIIRWNYVNWISIGEKMVVLEIYTLTSLAKTPPFHPTSLSLTATVVVRRTWLSRDIRTQRLIATTHVVVVV